MASSSNTWSKEKVAAISLFWPRQQEIGNVIKGKLINAMIQPAGALNNYLQIVNELPIANDKKGELTSLYYTAKLSAFNSACSYTLFKELIDKVIGRKGAESKVGIFLDAMREWQDGSDAVVAANWGEIEGLDEAVVEILAAQQHLQGNGEDTVDAKEDLGPFPNPKSALDEGFFEFDPIQAETELPDGTSVGGYFEGEILKVKVVKAKEAKSGSGIYKMSSKPRGVALIMNNMFDKKKGEKRINSPRDGCEHDEKYMGNLFQQLGFNTFVAKNVAKDRIVAVMEKYRSLITEEMDCFVFVIMSHGQLNEIQMADGNSMNIYADFLPEITRKMAPAFSEKPKLVFFQACQSLEKKKKFESHDGSGQSKNETETSSVDHVRLFFPALPADVARRQSATGSRFIYALTKVFMEQAHEKHIDGLRNEVAKVMKNMELPPGFERQNPKMDILGECDKLYFNPGL